MDKMDKPLVFMDGICPKCGNMCGNRGAGDILRCSCGWSGKMDEKDTKALSELIRRHKERNKEAST
ncbi:hypothetical protein AAEU42_01015 [Pseudoflavonifractor phocaeensis]|uniref:hypothetical protein n=1 Tax=Pseudoflavonifractor phocaeensis TaxID=1870988 RepID=UPI00313ABB71